MKVFCQLKVGFVVFCFMLFASCVPSDIKKDTNSVFFDLSGYLDQQINYLSTQNLSVKKSVKLSNESISNSKKPEHTNLSSKQIKWKEELAFFYDADISNPSFRDSYEVSKNSEKWLFIAKDKSLRTQKMEVFFDNEEVTQITIEQEQDNNIIYQRKKMLLTTSSNRIDSYHIEGVDRMIADEPRFFKVKALIK